MPDADVVARMVAETDEKLVAAVARSNAAGTSHAAALTELADLAEPLEADPRRTSGTWRDLERTSGTFLPAERT